jgi:membrane protease YdiL (CAAX protease family)
MERTNHFTSNNRRKSEVATVFITGAGKFIFMDWLQCKLLFIVIAILSWATYVFIRHRQAPGSLRHWGFRIDNFRQVLNMVLPFAIVSIIAFFVTGWYLGTVKMTWHIIPVLLLYPVWGTVQQFLVIGIVAGNLEELKHRKFSKALILFVTALLFGILHYPFYWLILGTFVLALFYGYIYLKARNIYVMGILHGWLGALFFYTVVGRDPFQEIFGRFF